MKRTKHACIKRNELFHNAGASTAVLEDCVAKIIKLLPLRKLDYTGPRNRPAAQYLVDKETFLRARFGDEAAFSGLIKDAGTMKSMTQAWNRFVNVCTLYDRRSSCRYGSKFGFLNNPLCAVVPRHLHLLQCLRRRQAHRLPQRPRSPR